MLLPGKETWPLFLVLLVHPLLTTNQLLCSGPGDGFCKNVYQLEHKTCDILAAERFRLMRFDNQLIIDSFQEAVCLLKW